VGDWVEGGRRVEGKSVIIRQARTRLERHHGAPQVQVLAGRGAGGEREAQRVCSGQMGGQAGEQVGRRAGGQVSRRMAPPPIQWSLYRSLVLLYCPTNTCTVLLDRLHRVHHIVQVHLYCPLPCLPAGTRTCAVLLDRLHRVHHVAQALAHLAPLLVTHLQARPGRGQAGSNQSTTRPLR